MLNKCLFCSPLLCVSPFHLSWRACLNAPLSQEVLPEYRKPQGSHSLSPINSSSFLPSSSLSLSLPPSLSFSLSLLPLSPLSPDLGLGSNSCPILCRPPPIHASLPQTPLQPKDRDQGPTMTETLRLHRKQCPESRGGLPKVTEFKQELRVRPHPP